VGFVVERVALGQVFSEYFGFPCQFAFYQLLRNHHITSGAGTIGQTVAGVPSGLSHSIRKIKKKNFYKKKILQTISNVFTHYCAVTN
jgi:hypothetical protein